MFLKNVKNVNNVTKIKRR